MPIPARTESTMKPYRQTGRWPPTRPGHHRVEQSGARQSTENWRSAEEIITVFLRGIFRVSDGFKKVSNLDCEKETTDSKKNRLLRNRLAIIIYGCLEMTNTDDIL